MLSVIIPVLNGERDLPRTLTALLPATIGGVIKEVIIVDGGSTDSTLQIADEMGATVLNTEPGRGTQLASGAKAARFDWLLFLHDDTVLEPGWESEVLSFAHASQKSNQEKAAAFSYKLDDRAIAARFLELTVKLRCGLFALPYGDQGLLISRRHYERIGGFADLPLMEDVDIIQRIGRGGLKLLAAKALTSAKRYEEGGYILRPLRNSMILTLYLLGVPPRHLVKLYG